MELIKALGFSDHDGSGTIEESECGGVNSYEKALQHISFINLAAAGTENTIIDSTDLDALQKSPEILARLIRSEPGYQNCILQGGMLSRTGEIKPADQSTGLLLIEHKRLLTYIQLAYSAFIFATPFAATGTYGDTTERLTRNLQAAMNIDADAPGKYIGTQTLDAILFLMEHSLAQVKADLQKLIDKNAAPALLMNRTDITEQNTIINALKYIYPNSFSLSEYIQPGQDTTNLKLMRQADVVLANFFDGTLIGPKILAEIQRRLQFVTDLQNSASR